MNRREEQKAIFAKIGERMFIWRKKRGLTQRQLAERINQQRFNSKVSNKVISRYEQGSGMRSIMFFRICVALEISAENLYSIHRSNIKSMKSITFEDDVYSKNQETELEVKVKERIAINIKKWFEETGWSIYQLCDHYTEEAYSSKLWDEDMTADRSVLSRYIFSDKKATSKERFRDIDLISLIILASVFDKDLSSFLE